MKRLEIVFASLKKMQNLGKLNLLQDVALVLIKASFTDFFFL